MRMTEQAEARERGQERRGVENTERIRYHSSDDMDGIGEHRDTTEPVAVVLRPDGSLDVYGYVGIIDQRGHGPDATETARKVQDEQGWTDATLLTVALDFIGQDNPERFWWYLRERSA